MAKCPKCGHKLRLIDIGQNCPECGVNMNLHNFEERFYHEAKIAELSQAGISCKIRRLKASFIGSKLTIARLVVMILPVVALLIPAGSTTITVPFRESNIAISLLGIYNAFSGGELNLIMSLKSGNSEASIFSSLFTAFIIFAAAALIAVIVLLLSVLCFVSIKNMQKITCVFSAVGIVCCIAGIIATFSFVSKSEGSLIFNSSNGFGLYVTALMFAACFVVNLLLWTKGIDVEYNEGQVERSEIWLKVKSGEINIDDLPYPVVETAETRKIKEEIEAERRSYEESVELLSEIGGEADEKED